VVEKEAAQKAAHVAATPSVGEGEAAPTAACEGQKQMQAGVTIRCLWPKGMWYRRSPALSDKTDKMIKCDETTKVMERHFRWVRTVHGWLQLFHPKTDELLYEIVEEEAGGAQSAKKAAALDSQAVCTQQFMLDAEDRVPINGLLTEFLGKLGLSGYLDDVKAWSADMGALFIEDIIENASDLEEKLGLRPWERGRLERRGAEVCRCLAHRSALRPSADQPMGHNSSWVRDDETVGLDTARGTVPDAAVAHEDHQDWLLMSPHRSSNMRLRHRSRSPLRSQTKKAPWTTSSARNMNVFGA
jgi:hypothetical protein